MASLLLLAATATLAANPIVPNVGMADPHAHVFGDRVYIYATHDASPTNTGFGMVNCAPAHPEKHLSADSAGTASQSSEPAPCQHNQRSTSAQTVPAQPASQPSVPAHRRQPSASSRCR